MGGLSSKPRVLVIGSSGQLAYSLKQKLASKVELITTGITQQVDTPSHFKLDLRDKEKTIQLLRELRPSIIINPSAYTSVENAEKEKELSYYLNATVPKFLAEEARSVGALFVHFSTDYVFDGSGDHFRKEDEPTHPLNHYGKSKLDGEKNILNVGGNFFIFRTSWVFSGRGSNFLRTILRLAEEKSELSIISDQVGAPTSSDLIANSVLKVLESEISSDVDNCGIYNLCCSGETSWYHFTLRILKLAEDYGKKIATKTVLPIKSSEYKSLAIRPQNSRLDCEKICKTFGLNLNSWEMELEQVIRDMARSGQL